MFVASVHADDIHKYTRIHEVYSGCDNGCWQRPVLFAAHFSPVVFELVTAAAKHNAEDSTEASLATAVEDATKQNNSTDDAAHDDANQRADGFGQ